MNSVISLRLQIAAFLAAIILLPGCIDLPFPTNNPVPDLDPATEEGADIIIYDINQVFNAIGTDEPTDWPFDMMEAVRIDWDNNGSVDLLFFTEQFQNLLENEPTRFLNFRFNGQLLREQIAGSITGGYNNTPTYLFENDLVGTEIFGNYAPGYTKFRLMYGEEDSFQPETGAFHNLNIIPPIGISYVAFRKFIGGELYYGWMEIETTDEKDDDPDDHLMITRVGISATPGLRIRMGTN